MGIDFGRMCDAESSLVKYCMHTGIERQRFPVRNLLVDSGSAAYQFVLKGFKCLMLWPGSEIKGIGPKQALFLLSLVGKDCKKCGV